MPLFLKERQMKKTSISPEKVLMHIKSYIAKREKNEENSDYSVLIQSADDKQKFKLSELPDFSVIDDQFLDPEFLVYTIFNAKQELKKGILKDEREPEETQDAPKVFPDPTGMSAILELQNNFIKNFISQTEEINKMRMSVLLETFKSEMQNRDNSFKEEIKQREDFFKSMMSQQNEFSSKMLDLEKEKMKIQYENGSTDWANVAKEIFVGLKGALPDIVDGIQVYRSVMAKDVTPA